MTDEQKMKIEFARVRAMVNVALEDLEADGGDVRFFNAALLSLALQSTAEVEGLPALERAIATIAQRAMVRKGDAGQC